MNAQQAYNQLLTHANTHINIDGADSGQCTAVAHLLEQLTGNPLVLGNAVQTYANAGSQYSKGITWPAPLGAVAVFGEPYGYNTTTKDYDGHTGVSRGDGTLFEQNDPDGSTAHEKVYTQNGYIGYFIPKNYQEGDIVDLNTARRIAFWVYGFNGIYNSKNALNGDADAQLQAWIGQDTATILQETTDDQYGQAYKAWLEINHYPTSSPTATTLAKGLYQVD